MIDAEGTLTGGCHCGAIRYTLTGTPLNHTLCHCTDCRRNSGAPMVGWAMYQEQAFSLDMGEVATYASSEHARRHFCIQCGTGLFYTNAVLIPGCVDVQSATLDEPDKLPPQMQIQVADRIDWMACVHELPTAERYPDPAELGRILIK
ncbi:GFA family protein [Alterisphingorhabdus coralli]|uniref:GFA family protein n=1 Tax=Alterisphingorhabdus coralli TaxID=3071408 RepID=A0AA97I2W3_9SPHN|nr:GFA family protein [Parasphingorhabdus sp. SCSIO 66989]WOE76668.1 GFA family protein [Parasphingorhabdus sp. SCSIO 66989]